MTPKPTLPYQDPTLSIATRVEDLLNVLPQTVADQSYPLTTPVYFVAQVEPGGPLRDFAAWIQSPNGQANLGDKFGRLR